MSYDEFIGFCREMRNDEFFANFHTDRYKKKRTEGTNFSFYYVQRKINSVKNKEEPKTFRKGELESQVSLSQEKLKNQVVQYLSQERFDLITKQLEKPAKVFFYIRNYFQ